MTSIEADNVTMKVGNVAIEADAGGYGSFKVDGVELPARSITVELVAGCPPRITSELVAR